MSVKCKGFLPILAIFIFSVFVSCSADVVWGTQESFSSQIEKATTEATGTETKMPKISYTFYAQKLSENPNASHATFELPLGKWICSSYSEETASTLEYNSLPSYYSDFTNAINPGYYISGWLYYNPTNENGTYNNFTKEDENSSESHGNLVDSEHYEWIQKKISYTYRLRDTSSSVLIEEVHENFTYSKWNTETESYDVSETCNAYISGCLVTKYQLSFVASSWLPRSDTKYTVYHYVEDADNEGKYKLYETETFTGITDDEVTVCCKSSDENYSHFDLKSDEEENKTLTIKGDGSSSENFYYDRKTYYITVCGGTFEDSDGNTLYGTITDTSTANDYDTDNENPTCATWAKKEGATLDLASLVSLDGYYVSSWKEVITYSDGTTGDPTYYDADEVPSEIQAYNVTYTPVWSIIPVTYNISYHIVAERLSCSTKTPHQLFFDRGFLTKKLTFFQ